MRTVVRCVTEDRPDWHVRVLNLVWSVRAFGGAIAESPVVVSVVDHCDDGFRERLEALGAEVRVVAPVDPLVRYTNKLRMFEVEDVDADAILALDCDTIVIGDPSASIGVDAVRAKPVDRNFLSRAEWRRLFSGVGLELPPPTMRTSADDQPIHPYVNSGVLVVPTALAPRLAELWLTLVSELQPVYERDPALGLWRRYNDQFALAAAFVRGDIPVRELPASCNYPTHLRLHPRHEPEADAISIVHFHRDIDADGFIMASRSPALDERLDAVNHARAEAFGIAYGGLPAPPPATRLRRRIGDHPSLSGSAAERAKQSARGVLERFARAR